MKVFYKAMALVSLLGISNFSYGAADDAETRRETWLVSQIPFFPNLLKDDEGDKAEFLDAFTRRDYKKIISLAQERNVNTPFENGSTPLHLATECECDGAVCILLCFGADVNAINQKGETPLHLATKHGYNDVVRILLCFGANVNAINQKGKTPLHIAAKYGCNDTARMLLCFGANVNAINQNGETPLHIAAAHEFNDNIARILLCFGANVDAINQNNGKTPLHIAAAHGHTKVARILLIYGAIVDARTWKRCTPLYEAVISACFAFPKNQDKYTEIVKVLLAAGADKNFKDDIGNTLLHSANIFKHTEITRILLAAGAK